MKADSAPGKKYCIDLLTRLVDIPSVFPREEEVVLFLEREFSTLGLRPKRIETAPGRSNLLCTVGSGGPRICLNAHADTVPPSGESVPSARIEGDLLYGLGSCDDKASIAALTTAFLELASRGDKLGGTIDLLISVDEEGDGQGVKSALRQGYTCDFAIVGEPTNLDIIYAHCGIVFLKLTTAGVATPGSTPANGISAIDRMIALVDEIRQVATDYPSHVAVGPPTLNLGQIAGGDRPNRVPDKCEALIDIRVVPPFSASEVLNVVNRVIETRNWAKSEVEKLGEPTETPVESELISAIRAAADDHGLQPKLIGLRGWTEAEPFRTSLGIDSVVFGPGELKQAHSSKEFVSIPRTLMAARLYVDAVGRLLG